MIELLVIFILLYSSFLILGVTRAYKYSSRTDHHGRLRCNMLHRTKVKNRLQGKASYMSFKSLRKGNWLEKAKEELSRRAGVKDSWRRLIEEKRKKNKEI